MLVAGCLEGVRGSQFLDSNRGVRLERKRSSILMVLVLHLLWLPNTLLLVSSFSFALFIVLFARIVSTEAHTPCVF